ncbi:MAG: hypothetical protein M3022_03125 [Actinomycetota bacterium]|nr:hypothetical protein [Actinomycetota bacterium]
MSTPGLFVVGALVTLIVAAALALLFYAAVLDGRYAADQKFAGEQPLPSEGQHVVPEADRGPLVAA